MSKLQFLITLWTIFSTATADTVNVTRCGGISTLVRMTGTKCNGSICDLVPEDSVFNHFELDVIPANICMNGWNLVVVATIGGTQKTIVDTQLPEIGCYTVIFIPFNISPNDLLPGLGVVPIQVNITDRFNQRLELCVEFFVRLPILDSLM